MCAGKPGNDDIITLVRCDASIMCAGDHVNDDIITLARCEAGVTLAAVDCLLPRAAAAAAAVAVGCGCTLADGLSGLTLGVGVTEAADFLAADDGLTNLSPPFVLTASSSTSCQHTGPQSVITRAL